MATSSALSTGGIIESASAFFGSDSSSSARTANEPRQRANLGGARQERAMARRLEQLQAALGESEATTGAVADIKKHPATNNEKKSSGTTSFIVANLVSALLGASVMWLATSQTHPAPAPALPTPAASIVTTVIPEPALIAPAVPEITDKAKVDTLLEAWRSAWAHRDVDGYLNAYSQQFTPADGMSREAWVAARTKKLSAGAPIDIQIRELGIERLNDDQFKATFLQDYASGSYREMARTKILHIAREGSEWRITKEWLAENKLTTK